MSEPSPIKALIKSKTTELGGVSIRRSLPFIQHRSVGPWVFFDHFGPVRFEPGQGMDVPPHPHINLATVTYLFEGEIFHRDSLGYAQAILPGAINLMVAGRGISHSERTRPELRETGYNLHGLQLWMALPEEDEEMEPAFYHHGADTIPPVHIDKCEIRVLMGQAFGRASPVITYSPALYVEARIPAGRSLPVPNAEERAIYVVSGSGSLGGDQLSAYDMAVLNSSRDIRLNASENMIIAIIGGAPLGHRHMWWNFISSRRERIEQAKHQWTRGEFGSVIGDPGEVVPLP